MLRDKVALLADWLRKYNGSCVVHVGAGLSTAAGIPDFRGKRGVWTQLIESQKISASNVSQGSIVKEELETKDHHAVSFESARPTLGHLVLKALCQQGFVKHIVSQNVDGLFLKANLARGYISELHGNFYLDECTKCRSRFIRGSPSPTMRLQRSSVKCPRDDVACKGHLRDTILDWESPIPYNELRVATRESKLNRLHICIGTSLQLRPSKDLVCIQKNRSNKLVIINLQPTKMDSRADLVLNHYADVVLRDLADRLDITVPNYEPSEDPTRSVEKIGFPWKK